MPAYTAEDGKLAKSYARTEAALVKAQQRSLDLAVKRLMRKPALAATLSRCGDSMIVGRTRQVGGRFTIDSVRPAAFW